MKSGTKIIAMALAWLGSALAMGLTSQVQEPAAFAQTKPAVELKV
jgi:hypothetical protein